MCAMGRVAVNCHEAPRAGEIGREIGHVKAPWVEVVSGVEDAGATVVVGNVRGLVPGNRDHVDDAVAEVDRANRVGPVLDAERLAVGFHGGRNEGGIRHVGKTLVSGGVVAVRVRVDHDQGDALTLFARQPPRDQLVRHGGGIARARSGIDQHRAFAAEQEIQERLFVVDAAAFPEDIEVGVVFVDLPVGNLQAVRTAGDPRGWQNALLDAGGGSEQGGSESKKR